MIVKNHDLKWVPHVQPTWAACSFPQGKKRRFSYTPDFLGVQRLIKTMMFKLLNQGVTLLQRSPISGFHHSSSAFQRPDHRLYGQVDWSRIEGGEYALVDPVDPGHILYLTEPDYIMQVRVCMTNKSKPIVPARPSDKRHFSTPDTRSGPKTPPPQGGARQTVRTLGKRFIPLSHGS